MFEFDVCTVSLMSFGARERRRLPVRSGGLESGGMVMVGIREREVIEDPRWHYSTSFVARILDVWNIERIMQTAT
jgi:hypothetical protein